MIEIIALIFAGRKFRDLAEKYGKTIWKTVLSAILLYITLAVVIFVTLSIVFGEINTLIFSLVSMPIGFGACYGLYSFLENKWKSEPMITPEIEDIGSDQ